ncbi:hypothetical protein [Methylorubrum sp. POS3]
MTLAPAVIFILTVLTFAADQRLSAYPDRDDLWRLPRRRGLR